MLQDLGQLVKNATVSNIWLIVDHDVDGSVSRWFDVDIELPDNEQVMTVECTVKWDAMWMTLSSFLTLHNWQYDQYRILARHQGHRFSHNGFTPFPINKEDRSW